MGNTPRYNSLVELYTCNTSMIGNLGADVGESRFSDTHYAFSNALGTRSIFSLRKCEQPKTISEDCETMHYVLGIDVEQSGSFAVAEDTPLTRHKSENGRSSFQVAAQQSRVRDNTVTTPLGRVEQWLSRLCYSTPIHTTTAHRLSSHLCTLAHAEPFFLAHASVTRHDDSARSQP